MIVVLFRAHEGAEFAVDVADVGVIDVAVDDVGDDFVAVAVVGGALDLATARVGQFAELGERREIKLLRLLGVMRPPSRTLSLISVSRSDWIMGGPRYNAKPAFVRAIRGQKIGGVMVNRPLLLAAQVVVQVLRQVAVLEMGARNRLALGQSFQCRRAEQVRDALGVGRVASNGPDGEDKGEARERVPCLRKVQEAFRRGGLADRRSPGRRTSPGHRLGCRQKRRPA